MGIRRTNRFEAHTISVKFIIKYVRLQCVDSSTQALRLRSSIYVISKLLHTRFSSAARPASATRTGKGILPALSRYILPSKSDRSKSSLHSIVQSTRLSGYWCKPSVGVKLDHWSLVSRQPSFFESLKILVIFCTIFLISSKFS